MVDRLQFSRKCHRSFHSVVIPLSIERILRKITRPMVVSVNNDMFKISGIATNKTMRAD